MDDSSSSSSEDEKILLVPTSTTDSALPVKNRKRSSKCSLEMDSLTYILNNRADQNQDIHQCPPCYAGNPPKPTEVSSVRDENGNLVDSTGGTASNRKMQRFKFFLHDAAKRGQAKTLQSLLSQCDPTIVDYKRRTVLHYACEFQYQRKAIEMVKMVFAHFQSQKTNAAGSQLQSLIDAQDISGETALHIAARAEHIELVWMLLLSSKLTYPLLLAEAGSIFAGAKIGNCLPILVPAKMEPASASSKGDNNGTEQLQLIYSKCPKALTRVFDDTVKCKIGDPLDQNLIVNLDFGAIVGYPMVTEDLSIYTQETKLLSNCLHQSEHKRATTILHPIVQAFVFLKWRRIRILVWISILYHVLWLLLSTLFIIDLYLWRCPYEIPKESIRSAPDNETVEPATGTLSYPNEMECEVGNNHLWSLVVQLSLLVLISGTVALKEMFEIYSTQHLKLYFTQFENIGQWLLIFVVCITAAPIFTKEPTLLIYRWQYQAAALGIFLTWSLILSQTRKLPVLSVYIEILAKVIRSFALFMVTFASLLVAFTVAFQILMPEKAGFDNFFSGFIKIMSMMAGDANFDELLYTYNEASSELPFPTSTKMLYAAFVSVVIMVLFNLLIGLTVSDIQGLQQVALMNSLSNQLEQIYLMEQLIVSKWLQNILKRFRKIHWIKRFLVTQQTDNLTSRMGLDIRITELPYLVAESIRKIAIPNNDQDEDDQVTWAEAAHVKSHCQSVSTCKTDAVENSELVAQIRQVLKEFLVEMKSTNASNRDQ